MPLSKDDRAKPAEMLWREELKKEDYQRFGGVSTEGAGSMQAGGAAGFTGQIVLYPSIIIPNGWLVCNGSSLSVSQYPNLFAVLCPFLSVATANASTNRVAFAGSGVLLARGDKVMFATDDTLPGGLVAGKVYFVWDFPSTDEFRVTTTVTAEPISGNIVDITTAGSGTLMVHHTPYAVNDVDDLSLVFTLPNWKRRIPIGLDSTNDGDSQPVVGYNIIGGKSGAEQHIHSIEPHAHPLGDAGQAQIWGSSGANLFDMRRVSGTAYTATIRKAGTASSVSQSRSEGAALMGSTNDSDYLETAIGTGLFDQMPPTVRANYIIKT